MLNKAVIFGATSNLDRIKSIQESYEILYATDNDITKYGTYLDGNILIKDKEELKLGGFDNIVIASIIGQNEIFNQLINDFNIDEALIIRRFVDFPLVARVQFLKSFSGIVYDKNIQGSVCEVGVFRGEFAKEINKFFPDRKCYLFDTFEGFDLRDIEIERSFNFSSGEVGHLKATSTELVIAKMQNKGNIVFRKGYFPETFDLQNEKFCFVNLDVDLYSPILDGLNIFWPRLESGGVLLVHDFFHPAYKGVRAAVTEFASENSLFYYPIGDGISIAFYK